MRFQTVENAPRLRLHFQSIETNRNMRRNLPAQARIVHTLVEMRKHRPVRARSLDQLQCHSQIGMGWMRLTTEAIHNKDINTMKQADHLAGNRAEVCGISN